MRKHGHEMDTREQLAMDTASFSPSIEQDLRLPTGKNWLIQEDRADSKATKLTPLRTLWMLAWQGVERRNPSNAPISSACSRPHWADCKLAACSAEHRADPKSQ